jgi:hypothetical protein
MRTVLLKDPDIVKLIQKPTAMPDLPAEVKQDDDLPDAPDPLPAAAPTATRAAT